jgi:hypothetical protein
MGLSKYPQSLLDLVETKLSLIFRVFTNFSRHLKAIPNHHRSLILLRPFRAFEAPTKLPILPTPFSAIKEHLFKKPSESSQQF